MKRSLHRSLVERLTGKDSIQVLARETGLSPELLLVLYTQRVTRDATRRFYKVKFQAKRILSQWNRGFTLLKLAEEYDFPPVLMAYIVLLESGMGRKSFWKYLRQTETIPPGKLRTEIPELLEADILYSPKGYEVQSERGRWGEKLLHNWLKARNVTFMTEKDLRTEYPKTPDTLFIEPLTIEGKKVHWIESKANFGDEVEINRNLKKQLLPYLELFGPGMVVYWFGFIEDIRPPEGVQLVDGTFFGETGLVPAEEKGETGHAHRTAHQPQQPHQPQAHAERPAERPRESVPKLILRRRGGQ